MSIIAYPLEIARTGRGNPPRDPRREGPASGEGIGTMSRRSARGRRPQTRDRLTDQLWRAILSLRTPEECHRFFEDVCTIGEMRAIASRLEVARLLSRGLTYDEIARRTGASSATISRVRRFLEYGADGYRVVLERLSRARG
jgi:TrpR-related protein YerC/YecD